MRTKTVKVGEQNILIAEKTIGELKRLAKELNVSFDTILNTDLEGKTTIDVADVFVDLLQDKLVVIFPQLKSEDIENCYPSEIEELIGGFIDVNFTGMKKVFSKVMSMM